MNAEEFEKLGDSFFASVHMQSKREGTLLRRLPDGGLVPVPAAVHGEAWSDFFALGRLVALSVRQGVRLPLPFTGAVWKSLMGLPIEAADVAKVDPVFFQNRVQKVLEPGGLTYMEDIIGEPLYFVSAETPWQQHGPENLVDGGNELKVTEDNKLRYVQLLCKHYLFGNVEKEMGLLCKGFEDLLPPVSLRAQHLDSRDLELMVCGLPKVDVEDWRNHTVISGPAAETSGFRVASWFWEVIEGFGDERRAKLLQFSTGAARLPPEGFIGLDPLFVLHLTDVAPDHLPTANTCVHQLNIPAYPSKRVLVEMLRRACDEATGFGFI
eukprot:gnl/MRDRNA2_/MRDRNA2_21562_c0_seq1.p1 gnl/MRDRNA2_/MRDRNA2_21562_c0~~gnl/MRDRNA2_/MRDRNA2_21562_c0_seq1.p1  ORF type:complete len:353 (-),score=83.42 gnl/MRDRNA2_/MRDRNA2_21562_c0_seq1:71-1042(-)